MKVLHVACVAPPQTGGIGQSASEIVKHLQGRGVEAVLVAPQLRHALPESSPSWVKRLPAPLRWGNAAILTGLKSMMRQYDVIHLHYPFFGTAEAVAQDCLLMRKPLVMTFHMDATSKGLMSAFFESYRIGVQPAIFRAARRIFVSSQDYADHSSLRGFRHAHPERVLELPFGVDHQRFSPVTGEAKASLKTSFDIPADARVIGFVGGMDAAHAFKGIPVLLNAMTLTPPDVHLLLAGDGPQRKTFEKQAKELGISNRCHFVGRVTDERLPDVYRTMDLFAFPSTSSAEAFGLVAVEAMASGIPVVASDLPGVRSVVANDVTGVLVPPSNATALADTLRRLLENESLRTGMGRAARERAQSRYGWSAHVDGLMRVYKEVIG